METVYLDNSATSFPKPPEVCEAVAVMAKSGVNADRGGYSLAKDTGKVIYQARESVAALVGTRNPANVIFTPSATIALNMVLFGLNWSYGDNVYFTPFEHNGVLRPLYRLRDLWKVNLIEIPVEHGSLTYNLDDLSKKFKRHKPKLVVVNHGSNVCGVVAPLGEIAVLAKEYGSLVLVDAAQTLGSVSLSMVDDNIDFLVFAGHKELYGPIGVGGLCINSSIQLEPLILGGTGVHSALEAMPEEYPYRLEAGSPNVIAIAGLSAGIDFVKRNPHLFSHKQRLLNLLLLELGKYPELKVFVSPDEESRLSIVSCTTATYGPQDLAMILDQHFNIAVRAGMHCAPRAHEFLGTAPLGTVRFSIGAFNTEHDIHKVGRALEQLFG